MDKTKAQIAAIVAAALAVLTLITSYGVPVPVDPFANVELVDPVTASSDGSTTAAIISQARKIALINSSGHLMALIDFDSFESPIEIATDVCVQGGSVFVLGFQRHPDSDEIKLERIVAYDLNGKERGVVHEAEGTGVAPRLCSLDATKDGVQFAQLDVDENDAVYATIQSVKDGVVSTITRVDVDDVLLVEACYAPESQKVVTLNIHGVINMGTAIAWPDERGRVITSISVQDDGTTYACENYSGQVFRIDPAGQATAVYHEARCDDVNAQESIITFVTREANEVAVHDANGTLRATYSLVPLSPSVRMRLVAIWVSGIYLVAVTLVLLARAAMRLVRQGRAPELAAPVAALAVVLTVGAALERSATFSYETQLKNRENEVGAAAAYLDDTSEFLREGLALCENRLAYSSRQADASYGATDAFNTASFVLTSVSNAAINNDIGLYVRVYGQDSHGVFCTLDTLFEYIWGQAATGVSYLEDIEHVFETRATTSRVGLATSHYEENLYSLTYVPSTTLDGHGVVIEVGSNMKSFSFAVASSLFKNVLALLVLALVIYMGYAELRDCARCVFRYRRMQSEGESGAISALARPFALTTMMLSSVDSVMSTLIAKDLLLGAGVQNITMLVALPAIMLGIGQALGQGIYALTGSKVGLRKLMLFGGLAMTLCSIATAGIIATGSFWAFCAAKLALSIPFGFLYTCAYSLRRHVVTKEQRELARTGVKHSNVSSAALGTALGGYAAQMLGNSWVYVSIAFVSMAVMAMAFQLIPVGTLPPEGERKTPSEDRARMRRFVLSLPVISFVLCVLLPTAIASGYASFIFPLFSSELGFEKADITNMYLLGQLVAYVCVTRAMHLSDSMGDKKSSTFCLVGLGLVFFTFVLNTTVVWGVAVIVLVALLLRFASFIKLVLNEARRVGVPLGWATSTALAGKSLVRIAKSFVLAALVTQGQSCVITIGVLCLACAAVFWLVARPRKS